MKVLVTGAAGFLGSHVVDALMPDHEVLGIDNLRTGRREWCACHLEERNFAFIQEGADVIVHCAATADISANWLPNNNRPEIYVNNVTNTVSMLEGLARGTTCKHFIFISTAAVESPQQSPYTASKIAGEAMCRAYCQALNIHLTIVRPVSILGKRYHHGHIADFVRMAASDGVIRAKDNGRQVKPYCHVHNVAKAIKDAIDDPVALVNCLGYPWSASQTADLIGGLEGVRCEWADSETGWTCDPTIAKGYYCSQEKMPVTIAHWVQETIDWCKEDLG